ncbi:LOG family protein [Sulfurimonas sp.]|uniref:LOG family protein n=1 Tax=Sulfurimonas sp. TaxID=2022749 RepID=UPI0025DC2D36|nr:LOG family protein [Sulfurimonas sp.]MDD5157801.1 LOG family protein [Sulfurimonas sp.]
MKKRTKEDRNRCSIHVPTPPEATKRQEKLPSELPKSLEDDPDAQQRLLDIKNSPSYRPADEDYDFLREDSVRGVRLQIDYLKTELLLQEHKIEETISVFGGTRILEEAHAKRKLEKVLEAYEMNPQDEMLAKKVKMAQNVLKKSNFYNIAREFGRLVGTSRKTANDNTLTIMTGGGPGAMEAANRGAFDVGAKSIGLNIILPREQFPNPYITPELCFQFHYFSMRKLHFLKRTKALVAFPGGFGTLDELAETLTLIQTRKIAPFPVVLVGEEFWKGAINFEYFLDEGLIDFEDMRLFWYAESAAEIWSSILEWHEKNGKPLLK